MYTSIIKHNYNDFSDKFTEEDGFQLAFAVIDFGTGNYSDVGGRQLDEYLKVKVTQVNVDASSGEPNFEAINIEHHACSEAELGLDDSGDSKFGPILETDLQQLKMAQPHMRCFDHSQVVIANDRWST